MSIETEEAQLQIRFLTKQEQYATADVPFAVPANIDCGALNKLVNELLRENQNDILKDVNFDFLVFGELLRVTLLEHLKERSISTETTVDVEYVLRTPAPEPQDSLLHDDWVSGVQVADKWILTGCYDNSVNIWSTHGNHILIQTEHSNVIKSVAWLKKGDPSCGFVTVSHDLTGVLWHWEPGSNKAQSKIALRGHERGIDSVGVNNLGNKLATGGWDTNLKIWNSSLQPDESEPPNKKLKGLQTRTPLHTLKGHKETISGIVWTEPNVICTSSMDHTIKLWDAELGGLKHEIIGQKAFLSLSWSDLSKCLITSSADRHIRLYDPRSSEGSLCKNTFTSHTLWVSSVCWSEYDEHLFMSGGYDQCVKMWDTRSPKAPLYNLSGHDGKVLCVNWTNKKYLVSGGSDNRLHIFKNKEL